jgi:hypothetical protein
LTYLSGEFRNIHLIKAIEDLVFIDILLPEYDNNNNIFKNCYEIDEK